MLEELQSLSEEKKKQVLIIATIIIMVIVIGVWATYFNGIIQGSSQPTDAQASSTVAVAATAPVVTPAAAATSVAQSSGPSLWQNIENGFGSIADMFKKPSQYNIQPQ